MIELEKDTANAIPFVLVDNTGLEVTGLGGTFTVTLSKAGGAFAASAGVKAELGNGWYLYTATAGECDTDGALALRVTGAGASQQNLVYLVRDIGDEVWTRTPRTLTQSAAAVAEAVAGPNISILRGDTLSASLTDLGSLVGYVSLDWTVKRDQRLGDDDAILRIRKNASGVGDGLLRVNGAAASNSALGSITIDDMAAGDITIALDESVADDLAPRTRLVYDIQVIMAATVTTLATGMVNIVADTTRAIS